MMSRGKLLANLGRNTQSLVGNLQYGILGEVDSILTHEPEIYTVIASAGDMDQDSLVENDHVMQDEIPIEVDIAMPELENIEDLQMNELVTESIDDNTVAPEKIPIYGNMNEGRIRKVIADQSTWKANKNKYLRLKGMEYDGYSKGMKFNSKKMARKIGPTCSSSACIKSKKNIVFLDE